MGRNGLIKNERHAVAIAAMTPFGVVVRIEHVSTTLPLGSFQRSHVLANANNSPSFTSKQTAAWPSRSSSTHRTHLRELGTYEISTHPGRQASGLPSRI